MTDEAANPCAECGAEAPVYEMLGMRFPARYCASCERAVADREALEERRRLTDRALARAGATPRLLEQSLDSFPADGAETVRTARDWIDRYRAGERQNLWMSGPIGVGKSGIAWGIVRELALAEVEAYFSADEEFRGLSPRSLALFLIWRDLLADLRAGFDAQRYAEARGDVADPAELLERARRVPVLALDDLGAERPTPYALEALANLVEHRYQRRIPTVVTSNYSTRELAARLGHDDPQVGRRIVERLYEGAVGIRFEGASRRRVADAA